MFTLSFNSVSISLPSPEFGDQEERKYRRIVRESRGKELIVFGKIGYPFLAYYTTFTYSFKGVAEPLKQALIDFLDSSIGQPVVIIDYNDVSYNAIVTTPSAEVINAARNSNEFTLEVELIG